MKAQRLFEILKLENKVVGIKRMAEGEANKDLLSGCTLKELNRAFHGETLTLAFECGKCTGSNTGFGFIDGVPAIPGGFGNFVSMGKGKGYPTGERVKMTPEIGEKMILSQPQDVMENNKYIRVKPFVDGDECDTVTFLVNPDQLSVLVHIFNFRKTDYDNIIAPMVSGCASIFRIPFGELRRENSRAVIGNIDIFARPHFDKNTFFFTVTGKDFKQMLEDAEESVISSPIFKGVESRL